jgi:tetratricopeptide (TPR) repeat protein
MMTDKHFIIDFEQLNFTVRGGYINQIPVQTSTNFTGNGTSTDLIIEEGITLEDFEKRIVAAIKKKSMLSYMAFLLNNKIGSILTILISLVIIILIALLSIHGSMTYDLFSGGDISNIFNFNSRYFYLLLSLIILLFLVVSPRIILGDYDNLFDWANSRFSSNSRIVRRLGRKLQSLNNASDKDTDFNLWNPLVAGKNSWVCTQLLPALSQIPASVNIMIRADEKDVILEVMEAIDLDTRHSTMTSGQVSATGKAFPYSKLSAWEKECMHCLLFCSTMKLPGSWKEGHSKKTIIISRELAERVYHIYSPRFASSGPGATTFEKFMNRCVYDYVYMDTISGQRTQNMLILEESLLDVLDHGLMEELADTVRNNLGSASENITDPLAYVILIGLLGSGPSLNTKKISLLSGFIRNVKREENYQLMNRYWEYISKNGTEEKRSFTLGPLQFLDVQTLGDLSACFVNSGMYDKAFEVFSILENIYPAKIAIEIADLKDSLGEYQEALDILVKTDEEWVRSGIVEDMGLILELYLNISWVIVSGRFEARREEGYKFLDKTETILRKLPDTENYLLFLTRYYNTRANYHEWEEDFVLAIENYEKALKLPGTILRKSSLLSNRGISERLIGKNSSDLTVRREHLLASRSNIRQAVEMKKSIGEKNQIPGTSHNLAETLIELARVTEEKAEKIKVLKEADTVTSQALNILDELNSHKRRGRLLAEKCIAHNMLGKLGEASEELQIKKALDAVLESEDKDSYDYREITRLLEQFGINK